MAAFTACLLLLFRRSICQDGVLVGRDLTAVHHPWRWFVSQALREGRLPLWNPFNFMGEPALANPQAGCFYPGNWLFVWFNFPVALTAYVLGHLLGASVGTFVLCRRIGCRPSAAAVGGAAFGFGGWMLTRVGSPPELASCALMPWVVLAVFEATSRTSWGWAVAACLLLASQLLTGNLNATYNSCLIVAICWTTVVIATWPRSSARLRRVQLAVLPATVAVAVGIFAFQGAPTTEVVLQSVRAEPLSDKLATQWAVPPRHWLSFAVPFMFGRPGYDRHWGGEVAEFAHGSFYVGVIGLVLAVFAVIGIFRGGLQRQQRLVAAIALLSAVVFAAAAAGSVTPLYNALRACLPGFNRFHSPYKLMFIVSIALSLLAGLGWESLTTRADGKTYGNAVICGLMGTAGAVIAVAFVLNLGHGHDRLVAWLREHVCTYAYQSRALRAHGASLRTWVPLGGVLLLLGASLAWLASLRKLRAQGAAGTSSGARASCPAQTQRTLPSAARGRMPALRKSLPAFGTAGVILVLGELMLYASQFFFEGKRGIYEAAAPTRAWRGRIYVPNETYKLNWLLYGQRSRTPFAWARLVGLCNRNLPLRIYAAGGENSLATAQHLAWTRAIEADLAAGRRSSEDLRLACVTHILSATNLGVVPPLVIDGPPEKHISTTAVSSPYPRVRPTDSEAGSAKLTSHDTVPERVIIDADFTETGLVELADSYYPGWRAWVSGRKTQVHLSDGVFRAVEVARGHHRVTLAYEPRSLKWGAFVTFVTLAAVGAVSFCSLVRHSVLRGSSP